MYENVRGEKVAGNNVTKWQSFYNVMAPNQAEHAPTAPRTKILENLSPKKESKFVSQKRNQNSSLDKYITQEAVWMCCQKTQRPRPVLHFQCLLYFHTLRYLTGEALNRTLENWLLMFSLGPGTRTPCVWSCSSFPLAGSARSACSRSERSHWLHSNHQKYRPFFSLRLISTSERCS